MHVLSLAPLSLLFPYVVLSTPLVFDGIPAKLSYTTPSLGKLFCPRNDPYNAWIDATNTQSSNLTIANDSALATSSDILTFPTAYLVDSTDSKSKRTEPDEKHCTVLAQMELNGRPLSNYNLPRTGVLQPGDKRIYAFSFKCNPGSVFIEVSARSIGGPDVRIKHADFGDEASGSVLFELDKPKQVRIRLDWGISEQRTCEFALFRIDIL